MGNIFTNKKGESFLLPFIAVTTCFALWGFANDITNPMVKSFSKIFRMSVSDGTLVQVAFYGGYFAMALPASLFIRRFSYKAGILTGLSLYAVGAFMFIPAALSSQFYPFLIAYFILTCGLSFLETSANPFVLSMGEEKYATRRLNLAQAFNPIGSLLGMFVAMQFIQAKMSPLSTEERALLDNDAFELLKQHDLSVVIKPYVAIGVVLIAVIIVMSVIKIPSITNIEKKNFNIIQSFRRLFKNASYRYGVIAQFFYVGAQITCWTFIIQYGTKIFTTEGYTEQSAEILSQKLNIIAMLLFCISRFVCTFLMKYYNPAKMLRTFALIASLLILTVMFVGGNIGLAALVAVSVCMSLMFPTIYALALNNTGQDTEVGSAGLIMAILGGSILPAVQAAIIDKQSILSLPAINISFVVPLVCFLVVQGYARYYSKVNDNFSE